MLKMEMEMKMKLCMMCVYERECVRACVRARMWIRELCQCYEFDAIVITSVWWSLEFSYLDQIQSKICFILKIQKWDNLLVKYKTGNKTEKKRKFFRPQDTVLSYIFVWEDTFYQVFFYLYRTLVFLSVTIAGMENPRWIYLLNVWHNAGMNLLYRKWDRKMDRERESDRRNEQVKRME